MSSQFSLQKRQCVYYVNSKTNTQQNHKYVTAGNVSGSVQECESTHCCVGYFLVINDRPVVDLLGKKSFKLTGELDQCLWTFFVHIYWSFIVMCMMYYILNIGESIVLYSVLFMWYLYLISVLQLVMWRRSLAQMQPARHKHGSTVALNVCVTQTSATATSPGHTQNSLSSPTLIL